MQQRLEAQEVEMQELTNQLQRAQVKAQAQAQAQAQAPPPAPPAPQPTARPTAVVLANPDLYERFRHKKAPDFEGSPDPLIADEWLTQIQAILNFMNVSDVDKVK